MATNDGKVSPFIRKERDHGDAPASEGASPAGDPKGTASSSASPYEPRGALPAESRRSDAPDDHTSFISRELHIVGQEVRISSKGRIRVDGEIQGNVLGSEVVIGDTGRVVGEVAAEKVTVFGSVLGTIRGSRVVLHAGSRVEGDVHHQTLSVNENAKIEGRVSRSRSRHESSQTATGEPSQNAFTRH